jgi:hypothetical protein
MTADMTADMASLQGNAGRRNEGCDSFGSVMLAEAFVIIANPVLSF